MPRTNFVYTNFTWGELTRKLRARVDFAKFFSGAAEIFNYLVLRHGGVTRRPGTRYVAAAKYTNQCARLVPFQFSVTQAYVIEAGCQYLRFFRNTAPVTNSAGAVVEIATPYAGHDLGGLDVVQSGDILYFLHAEYPARRLERYANDCWRFRVVNFTPPPSFEFGARPAGDLVSCALNGAGITIQANNCDSFYAADVGREIVVTAGTNAGARAGIKTVTNAKEVVANICEPFLTIGGAAFTCSGSWKITESPKANLTISDNAPVDKAINLTLSLAGWRGTVPGPDTDCGRFVLVNNGMIEITCVTSTTLARGVIRGEAKATTVAESGAWSLEEALWSATNGYPECGDFFDDRFYLPADYRFCGSKVGDYENFGFGNLDDDAVIFGINSKSINRVRALVGARQLQIFTAGAEYVATGGSDKPIVASNVSVSSETTYGSGDVTPIRVGDVTLFVTRSGRHLREFAIRPDTVSDAYVAPDLLDLADHLVTRRVPTDADPTIVGLAYQQEPESRLWAWRSDGTLLVCTLERAENVVAWSRLVTGPDALGLTCDTRLFVPAKGRFESVAVIPHPDGNREQVWTLVRREINGQVQRYIEVFDDAGLNYGALNTDATYTCSQTTACTTFVGLGHLEGETVKVVANGAVLPDVVVRDGNVTLSFAATKVEIGLGYDSRLMTLEPEIQTDEGSTLGLKKRWSELVIRFLDTLGAKFGTGDHQDTIPFRLTTDPMGSAPPLFTGDKRLQTLGWGCAQVVVLQTQPLPSTVLAIAGTLEIGG